MGLNFPAVPSAPDLNQPDSFNQRVLDMFTWCATTMPDYLEGLSAEDFFPVMADAGDTASGEKVATVDGALAAGLSRFGGYYGAGAGVNIDEVAAGFAGLVSDSNAGTWPLAPFGGFVWVDTQAIYSGEAVLQRAIYGYGGAAPSVPKVFHRIKANSGGALTSWARVMTDADGVLTTGAGGLLGDGEVIYDFSTIPAHSQFIAGGGAGVTADEPPAGGAYKPGLVSYRSSSDRASVLMFTATGIAVRNYTGGVPDGDWVDMAPERGSNANGEYVKLPDGTLICWGSKLITPTANSPTLAPITFPHAFNDSEYSPQVTPWSGTMGVAVKGASFTNPTTVGMDLVVYRTDTNNTILRWHCVGRWK